MLIEDSPGNLDSSEAEKDAQNWIDTKMKI